MQAADTSGRAEFVRQRLLSMKEQVHHLEVAVTISVSGIDVRSTKGKVSVYNKLLNWTIGVCECYFLFKFCPCISCLI